MILNLKNEPISYSSFWVSDLSLIVRSQRFGNLEGFVLNANTGEPIQGANVRLWKRENNRKIDLEPVAPCQRSL